MFTLSPSGSSRIFALVFGPRVARLLRWFRKFRRPHRRRSQGLVFGPASTGSIPAVPFSTQRRSVALAFSPSAATIVWAQLRPGGGPLFRIRTFVRGYNVPISRDLAQQAHHEERSLYRAHERGVPRLRFEFSRTWKLPPYFAQHSAIERFESASTAPIPRNMDHALATLPAIMNQR